MFDFNFKVRYSTKATLSICKTLRDKLLKNSSLILIEFAMQTVDEDT